MVNMQMFLSSPDLATPHGGGLESRDHTCLADASASWTPVMTMGRPCSCDQAGLPSKAGEKAAFAVFVTWGLMGLSREGFGIHHCEDLASGTAEVQVGMCRSWSM